MSHVLKDGSFQCRADFAVKVTHMMDLLGSLWNEGQSPVAQDYLETYLRGEISEQEVIDGITKDHPEIFAVEADKVAAIAASLGGGK